MCPFFNISYDYIKKIFGKRFDINKTDRKGESILELVSQPARQHMILQYLLQEPKLNVNIDMVVSIAGKNIPYLFYMTMVYVQYQEKQKETLKYINLILKKPINGVNMEMDTFWGNMGILIFLAF